MPGVVEALRSLVLIYELSRTCVSVSTSVIVRQYARVQFCERDRGQRDNHLDRQGRQRVGAAGLSRCWLAESAVRSRAPRLSELCVIFVLAPLLARGCPGENSDDDSDNLGKSAVVVIVVDRGVVVRMRRRGR